jgi:hypothetical protein
VVVGRTQEDKAGAKEVRKSNVLIGMAHPFRVVCLFMTV